MPRAPETRPVPVLLEGALLEEAALAGWHTLNPLLMGLTRRQVAWLLRAELLGRRRRRLINRLHQRLCQLRRAMEWEDLKVERPVPDWLWRELE